jgi:hypothetical protein
MVHCEAPALLDEPALQAKHNDIPADEYVYCGQSEQTLAALPPSVVENLPAAQLVQLLEPATLLYFPAGQYWQARLENDPVTEYLPAGQFRQLAEPADSEYEPGEHSTQGPAGTTAGTTAGQRASQPAGKWYSRVRFA